MIKLVDILKQILLEEKVKRDRCLRIADRKFDKPSAYKSGAVVRCRQGKIWKGLKEDEILNEYSDKIINQLINKFKQEQPSLETNIIKIYIDRFAQIKDSSKVSEKDITKYNWKELENIVDSNQPKRIKAGKINDGEPSNDANLVYNQNGLRIYVGKTKEACIKYGNGYSFCISSRGKKNIYGDYRFNQVGTPYFIFDDTKTSKQENGKFINPEHLLVLIIYEVPEGSEYSDGYSVTKANNSGEDEFDDFDEVEDNYPRLKGLESIFQNIGADPKERAEYNLEQRYNTKIEKIYVKYSKIIKNFFNDYSKYIFQHIYDADENIDTLLNNTTNSELKQYFKDIKQIVNEYRNKLSKLRLVKEQLNLLTESQKETLRTWFKRRGPKGKEGGWVDCNAPDGKGGYKSCGRKKGEKRAKYPSCRPTPAKCKSPGKGKKWGKTK
jgi:hypothetical protein